MINVREDVQILVEVDGIEEGVVADVLLEVDRAMQLHGPYRSMHEGYAIILEELDEVWEEIKRKHRDDEKVRKEMIQVAATAIRFLIDLCPVEVEEEAIEVEPDLDW